MPCPAPPQEHPLYRSTEDSRFNLKKSLKCEKEVQPIDEHGEAEQFVAFPMDGLYTENAGVIFCHPVGDETIISMIEEGIPCLDIAQQFQGIYKAVDNAKAVSFRIISRGA